MSESWKDKDSARNMVRKYNGTAEDVTTIKQNLKDIIDTKERLDNLADTIDRKAETKEDIGLGNVDNTSDMDKPVSYYQQQAIDSIALSTITSEPTNSYTTDGENALGFVANITVIGKRLVIYT